MVWMECFSRLFVIQKYACDGAALSAYRCGVCELFLAFVLLWNYETLLN